MPFQIIRHDITQVAADAIVNTANPRPVIGGGTDSAIYQAAGKDQLLTERKKIGNIERGQAAATPAFNLKAKYIIHTVGPIWIDGEHGERELLHSCYANSLTLAADLGCESIAFPMISTGVYAFPKDEGLNIALAEIEKFLMTHDMDVTIVVFDNESLKISEDLVGEIEKYIDENAVGVLRRREYGRHRENYLRSQGIEGKSARRIPGKNNSKPKDIEKGFAERVNPENDDQLFDRFADYSLALPDSAEFDIGFEDDKQMCLPVLHAEDNYSLYKKNEEEISLEDILSKTKEDTFQQRLFKLIDERDLDDVSVYKRANVDRKVFSKIRCNVDYHPNKKTAVAFAIALELDMPAMKDLLARAEFALSPSSKFDLIISYFVKNKNYNIFEINSALFEFDQPLLGY